MTLKDEKVTLADLRKFLLEVMGKAGMKPHQAETTADVLITTDTYGTFTHGSKQIRPLLKNYRDGRLDLEAEPEVVSEGLAWAMVDARGCMAMVSGTLAMEKAIEKARAAGIGYACVQNAGHFGAAGYCANLAMEQDMIGLAFCNVDIVMSVPGSRQPVIGTNPIAYSIPTLDEKPVFMDIATSVVAASKIFAARELNQPIPDNWLIDKEGVPTTDPSKFPQEGAVMPMAAHKGYGLALLVETITAMVAGGAFLSGISSWVKEMKEPLNQSHAFLAINVGAMTPIESFKRSVDEMVREIKTAPKAKGADRIYLPGETPRLEILGGKSKTTKSHKSGKPEKRMGFFHMLPVR